MIITEFSKYLQTHNDKLLKHNVTPLELLNQWLKIILQKNPKTNVEKVIHKEILYCENECGDYFIVGKSTSGRKLVSTLLNFCKSYDNYTFVKWKELTEQTYSKD